MVGSIVNIAIRVIGVVAVIVVVIADPAGRRGHVDAFVWP